MTRLPMQAAPDWAGIETVCLDMDGTVLDLRFDNLFWLEALPRRWGERRGLDASAALAQLKPRFDAKRGTLAWYCIDHWSEELGFDVAALKTEMRGHIAWLDGARAFLGRVRALGKRLLLTTNAHPISLGVKDGHAGLARHFDALVSSHRFGMPKESPDFWIRLAREYDVRVDAALFVDDSRAVLEAARVAGVRWIYQVLMPDSTRPPQEPAPGFAGIRSLRDLLP